MEVRGAYGDEGLQCAWALQAVPVIELEGREDRHAPDTRTSERGDVSQSERIYVSSGFDRDISTCSISVLYLPPLHARR